MSTSDEGLRQKIYDLIYKHSGTSEAYFYTDTFMALIQSDRRQFLDHIAGQLPEKRTDTRGTTQDPNNPKYLTKAAAVHNALLDDVRSILAKERERLAPKLTKPEQGK